MNRQKTIYTIHTILAILLGLFFTYSGAKKFIPKKQTATEVSVEKAAGEKKVDAKKALLLAAVGNNTYHAPEAFTLTVKSMKATGFLKLVGVLQIIAGLLMLVSQTRLIGALSLLPIILNIFLLHLFMDNDIGECIETGSLLLTHLFIIGYYKIRLQDLWIAKI